ncbi:MAG: hypothetical protein K9H64_06490 [Bacteroidales bacterium]|nr:hypothetical protein [Bacteroidales bacterium]MCF8455345.1 hypothetical protein [Bacteroidales bacterium]
MIIAANIGTDINLHQFNPSITLVDCTKGKEYEFPDPNNYFLFPEAGNQYKITQNSSLLLFPHNKHLEQLFVIDNNNISIHYLSKELFKGSIPIDGIAKEALELAIKKSGKSHPIMKNRL